MTSNAQFFVDQFASLDGTGTGTINQNVNGSVTPVEFFIRPPINKVFRISHMWLSFESNIDAGAGNLNNALLWGAAGFITNGVRILLRDAETDATLHDFTPHNLRSRGSLKYNGFATSIDTFGSGPTDFFVVSARRAFTDFDTELILTREHKLSVLVQDNLTALHTQFLRVTGKWGHGSL